MAEYLSKNDKVAWVKYPGLKGDKDYELAKKYMPKGTCGVLSFGIKGGRKEAEAFMKQLKIIQIETHVADAKSCCLNPATATHRQLTDQQLRECGISPELIRLSCGIEHIDDLIADVQNALDNM